MFPECSMWRLCAFEKESQKAGDISEDLRQVYPESQWLAYCIIVAFYLAVLLVLKNTVLWGLVVFKIESATRGDF